MDVKFKKEPHAQQMVAIAATEPEQLYGGAKRGGKTIWLCQKSFLLNFWFPGNRGLMYRLNFTDLQDSTLTEFFETIPSEFIIDHHKGDRTIFIANPDRRCRDKDPGTKDGRSRYASRQLYRGLGDPDEFEKVKGISLGHIEGDEPSEVPFETYLMLRAQLTWTLPDGSRPPYMSLLASNPEPGWVEDRFIDEPQPGCVFIPALPSDNPHLPPGYVEELMRTYPKDWVEKYVRGIWGASEGAVFKELDEDVHNLDNWIDAESDLSVRRWSLRLRLYGGFDHGSTGTTCYIQMGIDEAGNIFCFDEYYKENRGVGDHAVDILALKSKYENVEGIPHRNEFVIADPSITHNNQQRAGNTTSGQSQLTSISDLYLERGLAMIPGWNAMEMSIERMKEHLHPIDQHIHPFTGKRGSPSLFISKLRCPSLWKEMRGWKRKFIAAKSSNMAGTYVYKGRDHGIDPVRYVVNSRPRRAEFCRTDELGMTPQQVHAQRSHAKWAAKFGGPGKSKKLASIFK